MRNTVLSFVFKLLTFLKLPINLFDESDDFKSLMNENVNLNDSNKKKHSEITMKNIQKLGIFETVEDPLLNIDWLYLQYTYDEFFFSYYCTTLGIFLFFFFLFLIQKSDKH